MTAAEVQPGDARGSSIAGRYELRRRIAQGGMGEVFQAFDRERGQEVALKRLRPGHEAHEPYFKAEYHALARLRHPYIIDVYEYGMAEGGPYYTMELLDGHDLLETAPVSVSEACRMLRDVASSLALLHAQRLLHRDIGPRNVRRTSSGMCKLIDFGVMVPFGVPPNLAGTPPFVSPEAWEGSLLDQRSDLYSLGALAYWLLSRTFPYDPKTAARVGVVGCPQPQRLSRRAPTVPAELEDLVMSMLELDPARRPASAAEVIVRLNQAGGLESDDTLEVAQSYLASARFVGREPEMAAVQLGLDDVLGGYGSSFLVGGSGGIGRTRFLQEVALRAQTRGLRVVRAFGARARSDGELVREVYQIFRRMAPAVIDQLDAADKEAVQRFDVEQRRGGSRGSESDARDAQHAALITYVQKATHTGSWVLIVDDLDLADRFSSAFISSLAREAETRALLVLATACGVDADEVRQGPASTFARHATNLWLDPLGAGETHALATSLFGARPNLDRLADWLYRGARGNPGLTMELCAMLLRRGEIRYVEGDFHLPGDFDERVPADLAEALALRLQPLGDDARKVAELIATCRGSTTLELTLAASELDSEDTLTALEELVRQGVLTQVRGNYTFSQDAMRQAIVQTLDAEGAKALHARLARAYRRADKSSLENKLEAGWHLLHTEHELEGAHLLARITPKLFATDLSYAGAIHAAERALQVYERVGASLSKRLAMRALLVRAGYLYDHRLAKRYGPETIDMLERWLMLDWLRSSMPRLGALGVILFIFVITTLRWAFTWGKNRGPLPHQALQYLGRSGMSLLGVHALGLDAKNTGELLKHFEPFKAAPRGSSGHLLHLTARALAIQPLGREVEVREGTAEALSYLEGDPPLGMSRREQLDMQVGLLLSSGINECYRAGSNALAVAAKLEQLGTQIGYAAAQRIRLTYHLIRSAQEEAEYHRRKLEVHAIQGGTTWQVEWFAIPVEGTAAARNGDIVAARRSLERLEELVHDVPSLMPLRDLLRVLYQHRRGDLELALRLGADFVRNHPPRSVIGWPTAYSAYAAVLNDSGRHEEALELCERARASISEADREYATIYGSIDRELAFTYAALGRDEEADALVQANIERYAQAREPMLLSIEYENVARIARLRGDADGLIEAIRKMREAAHQSGSRFAIERARRTAATMIRSAPPGIGVNSGVFPSEDSPTLPPTPVEGRSTATSMQGAKQTRARNVLRRAMEQTGADSAFLMVLGAQGPCVTAAMGDEHLPAQVVAGAEALAAARVSGAASGPAREGRRMRTVETSDRTYELTLLPAKESGGMPGIIAMGHERTEPHYDLSESMIEKLSAWSPKGDARLAASTATEDARTDPSIPRERKI